MRSPSAEPVDPHARDDGRRPARPILSLIVDRGCCATPITRAVEDAVLAGVDWVQIRERGITTVELLELAEMLCSVARDAGAAKVIVNRRIDIALAIEADGAHLGFDALPIDETRRLLGPEALIGVSAHGPSEIKAALRAGADYAHLAPIHAPLSKPAERAALGLGPLEAATRHGLPVLAQGGLAPEHCEAVIAAGAAGIATTGAILMSDDPGARAAEFRVALDEAAR